MSEPETLEGIAIVGMAGRFPGARDLEEYWRNLRDGVESISFFSPEEVAAAGVPAYLLSAPNYVCAAGVLDGVELFDASFFGFSPREAELLDPHYRLFLEHAWMALESAGYDSDRYSGAIGVFGGMSMSEYLVKNIWSNPDLVRSTSSLQLRIFNDKDFLTSLTAYKLNLRGPSASVQTACSTSLVAISIACQSLVGYQCDMALAGGVSVSLPLRAGYTAHEGVFSPTGHCRAFDAEARGTVAGAGVGLVALKRLEDAVEEGDNILAVIRGWAMNNDGSLKIGYTAPSVGGQSQVVAMAQAVAGVPAESISSIEAHGTGTPLGDQVEVAALTQVFRESTDRKGFCALGSVKTNIGHLDAAAGVASLIKTVLSLGHEALPPSLNFSRPNPGIDFPSTPFYVNAALAGWPAGGAPRRAGVSAFSIGGVNAHLVVEEAPPPPAPDAGRPWELLVLSAKSDTALEAQTDDLAAWLRQNPRVSLADVAWTLQAGRRVFPRRRALVCRDTADAAAALERRDPVRLLSSGEEGRKRPVAFLFPGLGNHYVGMGRELYDGEPVFREQLDLCAGLLRPSLGLDIRGVLYPGEGRAPAAAGAPAGPDLRKMLRRSEPDDAAGELVHTHLAQPALFAVEYALAQLLRSWGIEPRAMVGYSLGEYVAACLAGVFTLEDAVRLVAERARMISALPAGAMLAVPLSEREAQALTGEGISLSAVVGPEVSVLAGPVDAVAELERRLTARSVACRRLATTHAFHSAMMDPIVGAFAGEVRKLDLRPPRIPFLSNVTGTWITPEEATDPGYWARHLRQPVRFADALGELWLDRSRVLLETGPGQALSAWALQIPDPGGATPRVALASMRHAYDPSPDLAFLLNTLSRLWLNGVDVRWSGFHAGARRRRVALPSYPFERKRYWIEPGKAVAPLPASEAAGEGEPARRTEVGEWFYLPAWKQSPRLRTRGAADGLTGIWLLFAAEELGFRLAGRLEESGAEVVLVAAGARFEKVEEGAYVLDPGEPEGYAHLLADLRAQGFAPARVLHLWSVGPVPAWTRARDIGLYSLLALAQAIGAQPDSGPQEITVVSSGVHRVTGEEELDPEKATLLGPCARSTSRSRPRARRWTGWSSGSSPSWRSAGPPPLPSPIAAANAGSATSRPSGSTTPRPEEARCGSAAST
jgi:acyl transferase domain-containing protein